LTEEEMRPGIGWVAVGIGWSCGDAADLEVSACFILDLLRGWPKETSAEQIAQELKQGLPLRYREQRTVF
jgi:hypothetical protein